MIKELKDFGSEKMSYGNVYIESDIRELKKRGFSKTKILDTIAERIHARYNDISFTRGKRIAKKIYEGKPTTIKDWSRQ